MRVTGDGGGSRHGLETAKEAGGGSSRSDVEGLKLGVAWAADIKAAAQTECGVGR